MQHRAPFVDASRRANKHEAPARLLREPLADHEGEDDGVDDFS